MSHAKERIEKNCLNCNAIVTGRYCGVCGQENIETHETFGHLAGHFVSDIFHFDGMFFSTVKYLLFRPGFLTYEYVRGRRASYLNPIKMYVFISAVFFLFFLTVFKPGFNVSDDEQRFYTTAEVMQMLQNKKQQMITTLQDKNVPQQIKNLLPAKIDSIDKHMLILQKDTTRKDEFVKDVFSASFFGYERYGSVHEYDSIENTLPVAKRDNWLQHKIGVRSIETAQKFRKNNNEAANGLMESFLHHFPQMLFLSLPLFALALQLLYKRRKQWLYANHIIYTVHLYCAVFIFAFLMLIIGKAANVAYLGWLTEVNVALFIYTMYYTYKAMRVFYAQGSGKTVLKWILLNTIAFFIMIVLFLLIFMFTFFTA